MGVQLDAQQGELQSEFRAFASSEVAPRAAEFDRREEIPRDFLGGLGKHGYLAAHVSSEYGGRGLDAISYGLLHEEFGRTCSSTRTLLTVHDMVAEVILRLGGQGLRETWLPLLAAGKHLAAFALTEPDAGSDAAAIRTVASRSGDDYLLTGRKKWISFGQVADLFLVVARIGEDGSAGGFLVERDTPGLTITPMKGLLGLRGSMLAELEFDNCRVSRDSRVGPEGMPAGLVAGTALHLGRYSVAWGCVGIADSCMEASFRYSSERTQFGVALEEHQLIQRMVANMVVDVRAARLLCLEAGRLRETRDGAAIEGTLIAKYFASRVANRVAADAVQIHGAEGVSDARPVERHFRDARVMTIIEGSSQIQQIMIARYGREEHRPPGSRSE
jgi:alkylation response protein AidB-like acyl-CoA dehydrogenase